MLEIVSIRPLRETLASWRAAGDSMALVPTMGALHAGHIALVKAAQKQARRVVVSIFVNPTQFGPNEDFSRYPRPLEKDLTLLRDARVDAAWLPTLEEIYPEGFVTSIHVAGLSEGMEGDARPGHFDGVATVVAKLLMQVTPDTALFGEKDYQQLCVIRAMVRDLNISCRILGVPTVREIDGLALSSRNQYLTPAQRAVAPALYKTLCETASQLTIPAQAEIALPSLESLKGGSLSDLHKIALLTSFESRLRGNENAQNILHQAVQSLLKAGFDAVDYLELRDANTLAPLVKPSSPARLIVAARLGTTRLLDNMEV